MRIIKLGLCLLFAVMSPLYSGAQNIYTWQDFAGAFSRQRHSVYRWRACNSNTGRTGPF